MLTVKDFEYLSSTSGMTKEISGVYAWSIKPISVDTINLGN